MLIKLLLSLLVTIVLLSFQKIEIFCQDVDENAEAEATPRPMRECERTYDLEKVGEVVIYPQESTCFWDIIGSAKCTPEIKCRKIDIHRSDECEEEYLKIKDGLGGMQRYCGRTELSKPVKASKGGRDLYISYLGPERGVDCTVKCGSGKKKAYPLPVVLTAKKEETGCVCGFQSKNDRDRIVNGENTKENEYPWQVAIVTTGTSSPICGGSLINDRFVLTAAHCSWFTKMPPENIEVLLHAYILDFTLMADWKNTELGNVGSIRGHGWTSQNKTDDDEGRIRLKVKSITNHPLFTEKYDYDVSLLRLEKKLDLKTLGVAPICLPTVGNHDTFKGRKTVVTGWGKPAENAGSTTRILQKLVVPVISTKHCEAMMEFSLTPRMLCAGYKEGGRDACMGDSGGPLILKRKSSKTKQYFQLGIVSWGEGCARKDRPGIYTRVTDVNQWIQRHTREADAVWCSEK